MIALALFLTSVAGFALLLVAMTKHQRDWMGRKLPDRTSRGLRLAGFAALALGFPIAGGAHGWAYGAVAWFGWLTIGAVLAVTANINRERLQRIIGKGRP